MSALLVSLIFSTSILITCYLLLREYFVVVLSLFMASFTHYFFEFDFALIILLVYIIVYLDKAIYEPSYTIKRDIQTCRSGFYVNSKRITLSHGDCNFYLEGKKNDGDALVVILHGFSGCSSYERWLARSLVNEANRQVLRFDWYCRGHSTSPGVRFTKELFVNQLAELLLKLNHFGKIDLIGYSMGGAISLQFAATYPEKINSLTLVSAAGMRPLKSMFPPPVLSSIIFNLPHIIQDTIANIIAHQGLPSLADFVYKNSPEFFHYQRDTRARLKREKQLPRAVVSTLRHFPFREMENTARFIGENPNECRFPVLIIWGTNDQTVSYECAKYYKEFIPQSTLVTFHGVGHMILIEFPSQVTNCLKSFWRRKNLTPEMVIGKEEKSLKNKKRVTLELPGKVTVT